ncbi:uncharacterized protein C24B11.05 isoform X2 [Amborella trichopoda]|uniref:uncharacterized protein C24B11.05 isoform X2 n=1 Tax=Amborella trichopoda TaxID=13333 RepID=UPI0005D43FEA|nr:uncharacterized protein C24B11.05 isoform X2 [Amborella trichopoda]|eukprot:XP_011621408.1 uncharacterized protein C24B11.05 isoform X2 [Amborella trichopoda]
MEAPKSKFQTVSSYDCLLFDLDDTLYSPALGIAEDCRKNIDEFLMKKCGLVREKATKLRAELFLTYGSSLAGLRTLGYDVDADDYHSNVHGPLPYQVIKPDPKLRAVLQSITQRKLVFTNSDRAHAMKVLMRLNLEDCFEQIICFESLNPHISMSREVPVVLKPSKEAMQIAIKLAQADPHKTVGGSADARGADYTIESIHDLQQTIPQIWVNYNKKEITQDILTRDRRALAHTGSQINLTIAPSPVEA